MMKTYQDELDDLFKSARPKKPLSIAEYISKYMVVPTDDYNKMKQAIQLLTDIKAVLYYGEDLKHKDVREFYEGVWKEVVKDINKVTKKKKK